MAQATELKEPDILDGVPLPRQQYDLIGHQDVADRLLADYRGGRQHHALVLGGPRGIGKATLAFRFARFVLANPDPGSEAVQAAASLNLDPDDSVSRRVAAGAHPNLLHLHRAWDERGKRFRTEITVDVIRRTTRFFGATAAENSWRVCIVDAADEMNVNAANALLKILEEPPDRALFLLVAHQPGRLLATIRSRCRRLALRALPIAEIETALSAMDATSEFDAGDRNQAAALSGGSLRRAISLLIDDGLAIHKSLSALVKQMPDFDTLAAHKFADLVAKRGADDAFRLFMDAVHDHLSANLHAETSGVRSAIRWADAWSEIDRHARLSLGYNLDRKQLVLKTLDTLAAATRTS